MKNAVSFFFLLLIFSAYAITAVLDAESMENREGLNWTHTNYDERGTNFSPQNQINIENARLLQDDWFYAFRVQAGNYGYELPLGSSARPLAVDGLVYLATNFLRIDAINMLNAKNIWTYVYPLNITEIPRVVPTVKPFDPGRVKGISYYNGSLYYPTPDCSIVLLDALTGVPKFAGDLAGGRICRDVPGNNGFYTGQVLYGPVFYGKGGVLITGVGVNGRVDSGRGFIAGYDLRTGKLLWRFFLMPPAGGDPKWSLKWRGKGNVEPVDGDWGSALGVGVGVGSGQWAVDEETGIVYVTTSPPAPKWNATYRPGPNLFSSSVLALDAMSGELIWYYQTTPHDLGGLGCDWNVILGSTKVAGTQKKVVYKGCGNGLVHGLDATTGKPLWVFEPPSVRYLNTPNSRYPITGTADTRITFVNSTTDDAYWQCPGITGAISSDMAMAYDKIFVATYNFCDLVKPTPVEPGRPDSFGAIFPESPSRPKNTTIYALDAGSGKIVWNFSIENEGYTGGLVVSGGVLYAGGVDKNFYAIEANDGTLLFKRLIGSPLSVGPVIAANANGRQQLLILTGGHPERWGMEVSGFVTALGVRETSPISSMKPGTSPSSAPTDIGIILFVAAVLAVLAIARWRVKTNRTFRFKSSARPKVEDLELLRGSYR